MPTRLLRLATIAALLAGACSGSTSNSDNTPGNLAITPNVGYSSASVATVITGTGFLAKATVPQGGGEPTFDTHHRVFIGDHELTGVTWQSTTKLDATVPKDIAPGKYDLTVENALGNRGTAKAAYEVLETPVFSATAVVDHPSVNVGQTFTLTVTIANNGDSEVTNFAPGRPTLSSSDGGAASLGQDPSVPSKIAAHGQETFSWTYTTSHAGNISLDVSATGVDSGTGNGVTARLAAPVAVVINPPAALATRLSASTTTPAAGQGVTMTLELANPAGGAAADVTAVTPTPTDGMSCSAAAANTAVPSATAPIRIGGGEPVSFTWTCTPTVAGHYTLSANVTANDVNSSTPITTSVTGVDVTWGASVPAAPVITNAAAGDGQVTLTWTAPNSNGAPITSYLITPDRGVAARTTPTATTTYPFDGLRNDMGYTFTVAAINSAGTGPASAPSATVTPTHEALRADMRAAVSGFLASAIAGAPVTGTATCTNFGPDVATTPTCSVTGLPVGGTVTCTPAPLPATLATGAVNAITCSVSYTMPAQAVTATVTAGSATDDRTPANNTAAATTNLAVAATPTFTPASGSLSVGQTVTITSTTPGAAIYCTSDPTGAVPPDPTLSTPCTSSYAPPTTTGTATNVKAIAIASGYAPSAVATANYVVP